MNTKIQINESILEDILKECEGKEMLVFGCGNDSKLWHDAANTVFIEDQQRWADLSIQAGHNVVCYQYPDDISVKDSFGLIYCSGLKDVYEKYKPPVTKKFDVILIDGPYGFKSDNPGRLLPFYWSSTHLSKKGTAIYIDDAWRPLEYHATKKFFNNKLETSWKKYNHIKCRV